MIVKFGDTITLKSLDYGDTFAFESGYGLDGLYMLCGGEIIGCVNIYTGMFKTLDKNQMDQEVVKIDNLVLTTVN